MAGDMEMTAFGMQETFQIDLQGEVLEMLVSG